MSSEDGLAFAGLRKLLSSPGPVYSAILTIPDPGAAAILGWSGFDYVVIDAEHAPFTVSSMRSCVDALASTPAASVVRVLANDPAQIKQALDLGVDGVQVPSVRDAEAAAAAVSAARYSPEGTRGVGMGHATRYGSNLREYLRDANAQVAVLAMIEDAVGF
jgi:2-keto-3-deoxy-L-rhamnonate aldolase RhmA